MKKVDKKDKSNNVSFLEIRGMLENISKKTSLYIENQKNEIEFINTNIYILNALLSKSILNGGIPRNKIIVLAGEESVGKSYLCFNIARQAQKEGYSILYIDTEASIDLIHLKNDFGIDISDEKFILVRSNIIEDLKIFFAQFIENLKEKKKNGLDVPKIMIFVDSIGMLASKREIDDAVEGKNKVDMSRAKAIKSFFRIITSDLSSLNIPLVATNHIYMSQDLFPVALQSGGKGVSYSPSIIVYLVKSKLKTGEEDELTDSSGIVVTAISKKNRLACPRKVKFEINMKGGINPYKGLEFFCTPENFEKVGIAKVKKEVDKKTGEIIYKEGSTKWYVRHLDKYLYEKQLFNDKVFTKDVLEALEPIIYDYFSYKNDNFDMEELDNKFDGIEDDENSNYNDDDILGDDAVYDNFLDE